MLYRLTSAVALAALATAGSAVRPDGDPDALVVHEWGTFTSIADQRGEAMPWLALQQGSDDLPCFVERFRRYRGKGFVLATVRMETPVLYFYAPQPMTVDVSVRFPRGLITEWFPHAEITPADTFPDDGLMRADYTSRATWTGVRIVPGSPEDFPVQAGGSHYYVARRTDAAPVEAAGAREKFLFYRGVANLRVPITTVPAAGGGVEVTHRDGAPLGTIILFERRGEQVGFEVRAVSGTSTRFQPLTLTNHLGTLTASLEQLLVGHGLYAKEAAAMVETWRDSWFEEGTRVFYVLPQSAVDAMLPLDITPRPASVSRVFVGRMEVITPETKTAVERAISERDSSVLRKYGRFRTAIAETILADPGSPLSRDSNARPFAYSSPGVTTSAPRCQ